MDAFQAPIYRVRPVILARVTAVPLVRAGPGDRTIGHAQGYGAALRDLGGLSLGDRSRGRSRSRVRGDEPRITWTPRSQSRSRTVTRDRSRTRDRSSHRNRSHGHSRSCGRSYQSYGDQYAVEDSHERRKHEQTRREFEGGPPWLEKKHDGGHRYDPSTCSPYGPVPNPYRSPSQYRSSSRSRYAGSQYDLGSNYYGGSQYGTAQRRQEHRCRSSSRHRYTQYGATQYIADNAVTHPRSHSQSRSRRSEISGLEREIRLRDAKVEQYRQKKYARGDHDGRAERAAELNRKYEQRENFYNRPYVPGYNRGGEAARVHDGGHRQSVNYQGRDYQGGNHAGGDFDPSRYSEGGSAGYQPSAGNRYQPGENRQVRIDGEGRRYQYT